MSEHDVASLDEITEGDARAFEVSGTAIVVCLNEGEVCVLHGICTHEDLPLDGGTIEDGVLTCPWHGAKYDVKTGRVLALPAVRPLRVYLSRADGSGRIHVEMDE